MSGIYTFWENERPLYVGRTNTIRDRIQSHTRPKSGHNSATFAFILAKERAEQQGTLKKMTRGDLEDDAEFSKLFTEAKARVARMHVRFVLIGDPCTQAIFEVYAAMVLAAPYNDFDNH